MFPFRLHLFHSPILVCLLVTGSLQAAGEPANLTTNPAPARSSWRMPSLAQVFRASQRGLLALAVGALALGARPDLALAQGPVLPPAAPPFPPALNPVAWASGNPLANQGLTLALERANRSGQMPAPEALPAGLSALLVVRDPTLQAILDQTRPGAPAAADTVSAPSEPMPLGMTDASADPADGPLTQEMQVALHAVTFSQLNEAYFVLQAVARGLATEAALLANHTRPALALLSVSEELQLIALTLGATAYHQQADFSHETYLTLRAKADATASSKASQGSATATPAAAAGWTPVPADPFAALLDPNLIYGQWDRLENLPSGQQVRYRISPTRLEKHTLTRDDQGQTRVQAETVPGAVSARLEYPLTPAGEPAEPVQVSVVVEKANGQSLVLAFTWLRAELGNSTLVFLIERDGQRKAFLKAVGA